MIRKNLLEKVLVVVFSLIFSFTLMEILTRISLEIKGKKRLFQSDEVIGWVPKPNIKYSRNLLSSKNRKYKAYYSTDEKGFRYRTDLKLNKNKFKKAKKLLIIGDSYTGGAYSSDNQAWFAYLDKKLNLDVYAYGIAGSGTLQQWLAYKRLKNYVNPDIVLIQACQNDIFNDSIEYSYRTFTRNQALRTPYLKDNKLYYRNEFHVKIYRFLLKHSNLFYLFDYGLMVFQIDLFNFKENLPNNELDKALYNWQKIYNGYIKEIRNDGVEKIWSVNCISSIDPNLRIKNFQTWIKTSKSNNVLIFEKPNDDIFKKSKENVDVYYLDGSHLSDIGNKVFGESLVNEIISKEIID